MVRGYWVNYCLRRYFLWAIGSAVVKTIYLPVTRGYQSNCLLRYFLRPPDSGAGSSHELKASTFVWAVMRACGSRELEASAFARMVMHAGGRELDDSALLRVSTGLGAAGFLQVALSSMLPGATGLLRALTVPGVAESSRVEWASKKLGVAEFSRAVPVSMAPGVVALSWMLSTGMKGVLVLGGNVDEITVVWGMATVCSALRARRWVIRVCT